MSDAPTKTAAEAKTDTKANGKSPQKKKVAKKPAAAKGPVFEVSHIEYIVMSPAIDTSGRTTARKDASGSKRATRSRTERFDNARLYRTGVDRVTVQTEGDEHFVFRTSVLEQILAASKDLSVTKEIPSFD